MKFIKSKMFLALLISSITLVTFTTGCGNKSKKSESENSGTTPSYNSEEKNSLLQQELEFQLNLPVNAIADGALDAADPTKANDTDNNNVVTETVKATDSSGEVVTEIVNVTDSSGEVVTEIVNVTESNGANATDSSGQVVTEVVEVTTVVTKTESNNQTTTETSTHVPEIKRFNAWWRNMINLENYVFNDYFIEVDFVVKEGTPDGKYPITITMADFACYDPEIIAAVVDVDKVIDGYIYVNTPVEPQEEMPETGFSVLAESVSVKAGESGTLKFKMKNNPGMLAVNFNFNYDSNAIEMIEAYATGEFKNITSADNLG